MSTIDEKPEWVPGIYKLTTEAAVLGFDSRDNSDGPSNVQAEQLAKRTVYLKEQLAIVNDVAMSQGGAYDSAEAAQKAIDAGTETRRYFNVVGSGLAWMERYVNINNIATPTGIVLKNGEAFDMLSEEVNQVAEINAQGIPGFPMIAEMSVDKNGSVTYQRLGDGTSQFPAIMVGNHVEQVQTSNGLTFQSRADQETILRMSDDGGMQLLKFNVSFSQDYPEYAEIHADKNGNVFKLVKRSGVIIDVRDDSEGNSVSVSVDGGLAIEQNGIIYFIHTDGENTALTTDNGNINPVTFRASNGDYFVRFASREGGSGNFKIHRLSAFVKSRIRQGSGVFIHIMIVGQSLSVGGASIAQPAITVTPRYPYGAVMFNGGPKYDSSYAPRSVDESDLQYLVPMAENIGKAGTQESDCAGLAERLFEVNGATCMVSATGSSGKSLTAISVGTDSFKATQLVMERGYEIATGLGMKYSPALLFIHGNADAVSGVSGKTYKDNMVKLRSDYESHYRSLQYRDTSPLLMFVQQFSNANIQAGATGADVNLIIGNAQYELCRDDPNFILTGTQYARPYVDNDHLSNKGYRTDGEIAGVAIANYLQTQSVLALRPDEANITQTETEVTIPLLGGIGAAVIDTVRVVDPGDYGFRLTGAVITGITVDESNIVHIAKTGLATAVSYAYVGTRGAKPGPVTGSRGCIRDSATDVSPVSSLPIYNDLVAFSITL